MTDTVFVLTTGEYSDYGIVGVVTSQSEAERIESEWNRVPGRWGNELSWEAFDTIDGAVVDVVLTLSYRIERVVEVVEAGTRRSYRIAGARADSVSGPARTYRTERSEHESRRPSFGGDAVAVSATDPTQTPGQGWFTVSGIDHARVRKVYGERRALMETAWRELGFDNWEGT